MKKLIIVSTGRCGTRRISEILTKVVSNVDIQVTHQTGISRLANVLGNLMLYVGNNESLKEKLFKHQVGNARVPRIVTDPLISMCIPSNEVTNAQTYILHIERPCEEFSESMFALSRKKIPSFIAHNFIPFWQPGLWPLENILNPNVKSKYKKICRKKNDFFSDHYGHSANYQRVEMKEIFQENFLSNLVKNVFDIDINISDLDLKQKSNQSK